MLRQACFVRGGALRPAWAGAVFCRVLAAVLLTALLAPAALAGPSPSWEFAKIGLNGVLYPSLMLNIAKMKLDMQHNDDELGDPNGLFGVSVIAPRAGAKAVVELVSSSPLVNPGRAEVTLARKGKKYFIYPFLSYADAILLNHQPIPTTMTVRLWLDGVAQEERTARVVIASVNDCVHSFEDDDDYYDTDWLYAAYVNENHPVVQQILREALATGEVSSFGGYQADARGVRKQVKAVWQALRRRGIRYSSINRPSAKPEGVGVQHVRLLAEALATRQANCVEGSCLIASALYKIGLETSLVSLPEHMLVAVDLDPKGRETLYLETTMLDDSTFEESAESGADQVAEALEQARKAAARKKAGKAADDDDEEAINFISIREMRRVGVLPIPDPGAGAGVWWRGKLAVGPPPRRAPPPGLLVVAVEPEACAVLSGGPAGATRIQGLGAGFVPEVLDRRVYDRVETVSDEAAWETKERLSREEGILAGVSSGAAALVASRLAAELGDGKVVVTVFPDSGERYFSVAEWFSTAAGAPP